MTYLYKTPSTPDQQQGLLHLLPQQPTDEAACPHTTYWADGPHSFAAEMYFKECQGWTEEATCTLCMQPRDVLQKFLSHLKRLVSRQYIKPLSLVQRVPKLMV
ncbi:hypothetical protein OEZ85_002658 [Tetradesmus obliquus]|uniref:Uncharacterized protein n=1 Tax=Tetradesmus obliquus TaxID=3088 RepID=A0ABY8TYA4_TETOB|nr:hypothetical protein OEZ85_002658 [Tetradesmus obliquus]